MPDTGPTDGKAQRTNLQMPPDVYRRIAAEALADRRTTRPEILVLLTEALDARDKKAGRAARLPQGNPGGASD